MCGICGIATPPDGKPVPPSLVKDMCSTIVHRGPDDQGVYTSQSVGLGVRRLSIIDLEGGHQPLSNEEGTIWIAHNGEVYNFPSLRKELLSRGHTFRTKTDTETVAHAYEEWGEEVVRRMRGMYATAVWDARRESLLLIRDRLGIKPLYYTLLDDGTLVFGSELKAVLVHPGVKRVLEPQALDLYLTLEYIPAPFSIFKNIFKLPAGCLLVYRRGRIQVRPYWILPQEREECSPHTAALQGPALMDELYERLKESVRLRLISDVPLGAFLSGGIDSSAIVGLMNELGVSPVRTFSIGFEDASYNELNHARRVAEKFHTEHREGVLRPRALDLVEKLIHHLDEPFGDFSIFPTYLVSKMARSQVKVILSGDGGDEIFGGYEHYQAQKLAFPPVPFLAGKILLPLTRLFPPADKKKGAWNKLRRFCQGFQHESGLRHLRWMMFLSDRAKEGLYTEAFIEKLGGITPLDKKTPFQAFFAEAGTRDAVNGELHLDVRSYLVDDILVKVDRMSMAASLETRVPLLDHELVEFAFSLPGRFKVKGLNTKWLFKKTMERLLPRENIYRGKEGFSIPIKHWLRRELKPMLLEYLDAGKIGKAGFFRPSTVRNMIDAHLENRENFSHSLWALLVFELWRERYL